VKYKSFGRTAKISVSVISVLALAACGGSGSDQFDTDDAGFDAMGNAALAAIDVFSDVEGEGASPYAAVENASGTAAYDGVAVVTSGPESTGVIDFVAGGSLALIADFDGAGTVTGSASGFYQIANPEVVENGPDDITDFQNFTDLENAGAIEGSLDFDMGVFNLGGAALATGTVDGDLTALDTTVIDVDNAAMDGAFIGDDLDVFGAESTTSSGSAFVDITIIGLAPQ